MPKPRRILDIPLIDRPREKLERKGVHALSDFELLEVMIGSGNGHADVGSIARQIQKLLRGGTQAFSLKTLTALRGVSNGQASKILASLELAKRHLVKDVQPLRTQQELLSRVSDIRDKQQEHFLCLSMDGGHRLIAQRTVTIGTLDTVLAHPREIFSDPIVDRAAYIIVVHNHPSGDPMPSQKDITLTQQLAAAGQLLGVPLRDHFIVTKTEDYSFKQRHLL